MPNYRMSVVVEAWAANALDAENEFYEMTGMWPETLEEFDD